MSALHDLEPNPEPVVEEESNKPRSLLADLQPSGMNLIAKSIFNRVTGTFQMGRGMLGVGRDLSTTLYNIWRGDTPMPPIYAPKTRFNQPVGPYRVMEAAVFDLEDIKMIKNATGKPLSAAPWLRYAEAKYLEQ